MDYFTNRTRKNSSKIEYSKTESALPITDSNLLPSKLPARQSIYVPCLPSHRPGFVNRKAANSEPLTYIYQDRWSNAFIKKIGLLKGLGFDS